jgi:hypothetical protein
MFQPGTERATALRPMRVFVATAALASALFGCSDIYFDRRDTIALSAGDAVAANAVEQMIDPWPARSGDTNIAFNGQKMQSAIERYRNDKVTPPINPTTSEVENMQQQAAAATTAAASAQATPPPPPPVAAGAATAPGQ